MTVHYPDYIKLVFGVYKKKRANNELSLLLAKSTPANIRQACLHVYKENFDKQDGQIFKKDEQILKDFFGPAAQGKKFLAVIQAFEADRFRPLDGYLKEDGKKGISVKSLELLAWLIDFQHRPYVVGMDVALTDEEQMIIDQSKNELEKAETEPALDDTEITEIGTETDEEQTGIDQAEKGTETTQTRPAIDDLKKTETIGQARKEQMTIGQSKSVTERVEVELLVNEELLEKQVPPENTTKNKSKRALIIFLMLVLCTGGIYAIWPQRTGCMYWVGDHYEQVPCNEKINGTLFPLDEDKMKNFKRIMNKDTITEKSINTVYYISNGELEFYTTGGNHPIYTTRPLRKLSRYMFDKYLRKNQLLNAGSLAK